MNVMFKVDGAVVTPKLTGSVLPGITRRSCLELLRSWGLPVEERLISAQELFDAAQAGRLVVMAKGKVVADGTPKSVFSQVEELRRVGLTVPQTTALLWELRQEGYDVPLDALSDEECAQALYRLLQ